MQDIPPACSYIVDYEETPNYLLYTEAAAMPSIVCMEGVLTNIGAFSIENEAYFDSFALSYALRLDLPAAIPTRQRWLALWPCCMRSIPLTQRLPLQWN
jgi:hypothetical protein